MELISKKQAVEALKEVQSEYRTDTETGQNIREGVQRSIEVIETKRTSHFTLRHLGHADLKSLKKSVESELKKLEAEPEVLVFEISGMFKCDRYTQDSEKAKLILKEELKEMLSDIETDWAESSLKIATKSVKKSDLKDYELE